MANTRLILSAVVLMSPWADLAYTILEPGTQSNALSTGYPRSIPEHPRHDPLDISAANRGTGCLNARPRGIAPVGRSLGTV